jgi:hypothetical protein
MPETFTPLSPAMFSRDGSLSLPSAPASSSPRLSALSSASAPAEISAASVPAPSPANCSGKPVVTLQRNGDVVTAIKVQCTCGQVIELNCQY